MKIINLTQNTILAKNCKVADRFFLRFKGLMGEKNLPQGSGLLITPCSSIHMFFMRFPLDVVFIDKDNRAVYLIEGIRPWRLSPVVWKACSAIELPAGTIKASYTTIGDRLVLEQE